MKQNMTFEQWMNRPVQRVWVYTWLIACGLRSNFPSSIRFLPASRSPEIRAWRQETVAAVRRARAAGSVNLPTFTERAGGYA